MSTISTCNTCAATSMSLISLKKWNSITIGCTCLLGLSGLSLSVYLLLKYLKLKKSVNSLHTKIQDLTSQINSSLKMDIATTRPSRSKERKNKNLQQQQQHPKPLSSASSIEDNDDYETPDEYKSPTRVDTRQTNNSFKEIKKNSFVNFDLNLNDNRSLELMQMQSYENKKLICSNNQCKYEQVRFYFICLFYLNLIKLNLESEQLK